ncbi:hypothetical protein [Leifsonia sp. AG29]|uniref:hypothetical protein n=1 Tax=Leifsonia sp. AG29 TaxID=2598860 RepID=UPI00131B0A1B|nr:hypothetical protein [Leifsonia sp. AG29]
MKSGGAGDELLPLVLFLLLAVLFAGLGVYSLVRPEAAARFFADSDSGRTFRPRDARAVGAAFALGGGVLAVLGAVRLVVLLTAA